MPIEQISSGGTVTYLHHDQAGSTRLLTGSTGTVTGKCTYAAYGTPACEGTATTPLGFDGEYASSDTGLLYMRARTYDPSTAQFLSVDPLEELSRAPFNFAEDNPLNERDPTGLFALGEIPIIGGGLEAVATRFVGFWDGFTQPVFGGTAAIRAALGLNGGLDQCSSEYQVASEVGGYTLDAEAVAPLAYAGGTGAGVILGSVGSEGATEATGNLFTDLATQLPDAEIAKLRAAALTLGGTGLVGYAEVRGLQAVSAGKPSSSTCGCS
jgi:RHS repeat-associated protein